MSHHPATEALRSHSPEQLHAALVATLSENEHGWLKDVRDLMVALAPFHDCADRLGLDIAVVFRNAANEGPARLRGVVVEFGLRTDVTPSAFGFAVADEPDGLAYRFN